MKRTLVVFLLATVLSLGSLSQADVMHQKKNGLVGVWEIEVQGASYAPHLFTFHADGTMLSTNPGNVQLNSSEPHGGTNDSLGMGVWESVPGEPDTYIGTFCELNAHADNHKPADSLYVSYKIKVSGDTFSGNAVAKQGTATHKAKLIGHSRIKINHSIIDSGLMLTTVNT